jgi:hypothetical protein
MCGAAIAADDEEDEDEEEEDEEEKEEKVGAWRSDDMASLILKCLLPPMSTRR